MFFDKKDEKKALPDLPSPRIQAGTGPRIIPPKRELGEEGEVPLVEDNPLPAFPDSPSGNSFSQVAIKDAVGERESAQVSGDLSPIRPGGGQGDMQSGVGRGEMQTAPQEEQPMTSMEMEEWQPTTSSEDSENYDEDYLEDPPEMDEEDEGAAYLERPRVEVHKPVVGDVFVKIDKFHSAKKALGDVQVRLGEIDALVKKIRDTKLREEQELASWERDITHIKSRVQGVSENIFEKVE